MVLDAVSNFVRGTADAAVGTDDTTVSVADASIFPDPSTDGEFNVVIWDANNFPRPDQDADVEILRVTERDTTDDELTVTRAQETTSAASHPEGSAIHLSPTAKMFSDIESTFGDFWNPEGGENGQLTADVNNTNTTTQNLEAESGSVEKIDTGRTWQDVSASRAFNTIETNDTGSEITVSVSMSVQADETRVNFILAVGSVNDRNIDIYDTSDGDSLNTGQRRTVSGKIPPGEDYEVFAGRDDADYQINEWFEFRP